MSFLFQQVLQYFVCIFSGVIPDPTGFIVFCLYIFRSDSRSCRFYSILFVYFQE